MSVTAASTAATSSLTSAALNSAASNAGVSSGDFLTLMVGELQNQDPLDPTSTTDFVNQMAQYANFDQEQTLNTNMGSLLSSFNNLLTMNAVNYIGHTVVAQGNTATLQNGEAQFGYTLASAASKVALSVQDSSGATVWSGTGTTNAGSNTFTWNGQDSNGNQLSDGGQFTLTVSAADASGNSVTSTPTVTGTVTGIDNSSGSTMLTVGGVPISVSSVIGVR